MSALAETAAGVLRGSADADGGIDSFLGAAFAKPPIGALRWAPPQPLEPWRGERDALLPAPPAPQPERPIGTRSHGELPPADEDCLRVNVWAPSGRSGLPVLVWLHGGGFALGSPSAVIFDGASLARALDAVVVTVGYRLGSLGWLAHEALAAAPGAAHANWGLQDQLAALRWTHENAAAFGGDPSRIVLAGESAGAASTIHLLADPAARGLLARAIAMSPPLGEGTLSAAFARAWSEALGDELLGSFEPERLRALPVGAVVDAHERLLAEGPFHGGRGGAMPVLDGVTIAADPLEAPPAATAIDVLVGTNADEATFFYRQPGRVVTPDDEALAAIVTRLAHGASDAAAAMIEERRRADPAADNNEILVRIATEAIFEDPVGRWAAARAGAGGRVHRYRIEHRSPQPGLGAVHTIGVPLLFGTHRTSVPGEWVAGADAAADAASQAIRAAWRGFVHDGDPGWAPQTAAGGELGVLGGSGGGLRVDPLDTAG